MKTQNNNKIQKTGNNKDKTDMALCRMSAMYSGPIPPASELEKYEKTLPGAANRILAMAEAQSTHRQEIEKEMVNANIKLGARGQIFGFLCFISILIAGLIFIMLDKNIVGLASIITAAGGIVGTFVYGRISAKKELREKSNKP